MNETMSMCIIKYMLEIVKDYDIHRIFEMASELSKKTYRYNDTTSQVNINYN